MKMVKSKKFIYRVTQNGTQWSTEIVRRKTAKETVVSKKQSGFPSEAEAQAWGETELVSFLKNLKARNQRHNAKR